MSTAAPARSRRKPSVTTATMKAEAIDRFGPPSVLKMHTIEVPELGDHDVLIALHTAGVGSWDAQLRSGEWATGKEKFPLVLGIDGAGVIAAKGSRVRRLDVGDRVWAYAFKPPKGGFYAEYVVVDADSAYPLPRGLNMTQAGVASVTGLTALQGIEHLRLRRNETVLIFGATGAVGTLAVQFAKQRRANVIATATGRAAAALVRKLGADEVIDPRSRTSLDQLEEIPPGGIDAVLALAGGPVLERCLDLVPTNGRVAMPNGVEPEPKRRRKFRLIKYDGNSSHSDWEKLSRAVSETKLRVPIAATYPLSQAARAHARLERGHVLGRIALRIRRS